MVMVKTKPTNQKKTKKNTTNHNKNKRKITVANLSWSKQKESIESSIMICCKGKGIMKAFIEFRFWIIEFRFWIISNLFGMLKVVIWPIYVFLMQECGRKWVLLSITIKSHRLVPFATVYGLLTPPWFLYRVIVTILRQKQTTSPFCIEN